MLQLAWWNTNIRGIGKLCILAKLTVSFAGNNQVSSSLECVWKEAVPCHYEICCSRVSNGNVLESSHHHSYRQRVDASAVTIVSTRFPTWLVNLLDL